MIRPPWAASLWQSDEWLYVELPATIGHLAHTIRVPATVEGMTKILDMLKVRDESSRIGSKGDPTQWQVDRNVVSYDEGKVKRQKPKDKFSPQIRSGARDVLRKLGMIS